MAEKLAGVPLGSLRDEDRATFAAMLDPDYVPQNVDPILAELLRRRHVPDPPPDPARRKVQYRKGSRGRLPLLTEDEARAAVTRARQVGVDTAARELGVSRSCLQNTWTRHGIDKPGPPARYVPHPGKRVLTREQAIAAADRARLVGRDQVARELFVSVTAIGHCWRLYGIKGPGKGHAARIREQRRRART